MHYSTGLSDDLLFLYLFKVTLLSKYIGWSSSTLLPNLTLISILEKRKTTLIFHFCPQNKSINIENTFWGFLEGDHETVTWEVPIVVVAERYAHLFEDGASRDKDEQKSHYGLLSPSQLDPIPWH